MSWYKVTFFAFAGVVNVTVFSFRVSDAGSDAMYRYCVEPSFISIAASISVV